MNLDDARQEVSRRSVARGIPVMKAVYCVAFRQSDNERREYFASFEAAREYTRKLAELGVRSTSFPVECWKGGRLAEMNPI